jgi:hypothetical protein
MQNFQGKSALDAEIGRGASPSRRKVLRLLGNLSLLQNLDYAHIPSMSEIAWIHQLSWIARGEEIGSLALEYYAEVLLPCLSSFENSITQDSP